MVTKGEDKIMDEIDDCACCQHPVSEHDAVAKAYCMTTLHLALDGIDVSDRTCAC